MVDLYNEAWHHDYYREQSSKGMGITCITLDKSMGRGFMVQCYYLEMIVWSGHHWGTKLPACSALASDCRDGFQWDSRADNLTSAKCQSSANWCGYPKQWIGKGEKTMPLTVHSGSPYPWHQLKHWYLELGRQHYRVCLKDDSSRKQQQRVDKRGHLKVGVCLCTKYCLCSSFRRTGMLV